MGLSTATRESSWLKKLTWNVGLDHFHPVEIFYDNEASIKMVVFTKKITETSIIMHTIITLEKYKNENVKFYYVTTLD
jgi:hypothetical protein